MNKCKEKDSVAILLIEDNEDDQHIISMLLEESQRVHFTVTTSSDLAEGLQALKNGEFDVVLSDLNLPDSVGLETANRVQESIIGIPLLILTGNDDEEFAIEALKCGAQDYISKQRLTAPGIERAVIYAIERNRLFEELRRAQEEIKALQGIIPICSFCKKIRDDKGYWDQIETYISKHSEALFSHSVCPDCVKEYYKDLEK